MILTPHVLVGAAIAINVEPKPLGLVLAFLSHYILDAIPHWDYCVKNIQAKRWKESLPDFTKVGLDTTLSLLIIALVVKNWRLALIGGAFGIISDGVTLLTIMLPENKILEMHHLFHDKIVHWFKRQKIPVFWKILSQLGISIISIFLLRLT